MNGHLDENHAGDQNNLVMVVFRTNGKVDALVNALKVFQDYDLKLKHIESRTTPKSEDEMEFFLECGAVNGSLKSLLDDLNEKQYNAKVLNTSSAQQQEEVAWFPCHIQELDRFANRVHRFDDELDSAHPTFEDQQYKARRKMFTDIACNYKHGAPIPRIEYTKEEIKTWNHIFTGMSGLFPTHACHEYNVAFAQLVEKCGYREDNIPQLQDVADFLKGQTGFQLRPVAGLLSSRDFLNGLAFRVFHCTQYVRHPAKLTFSEEPDICHELLGHVPMFADPEFAAFSQEIGLASLGASDEYVNKIATCYWYTIEVGLCRQDGEIRAYGAAILSSNGELQYSLSDKVKMLPFDPAVTSETPFVVTDYQANYFVAESFSDAKDKMRAYAATIPRPFTLRYNAHIQSVEVLQAKDQLAIYAADIKADVARLESAITKYGKPVTILEE